MIDSAGINNERLKMAYESRHEKLLKPLEVPLYNYLVQSLSGEQRIDRISVRSKSIPRFIEKADKIGDDGKRKYSDPINQIQDQLAQGLLSFMLMMLPVLPKGYCNSFARLKSRI